MNSGTKRKISFYSILSFVLVTFFYTISFSQTVVTNYSANKIQGCGSLIVTFTDFSVDTPAGNPIIYRKWDMGQGTVILQDSIVNFTYTPGTYTVTLITASDTSGGSANYDTLIYYNYITVSEPPVPDYSLSTDTGCLPLTITFTDQSTSSGAPIEKYVWIFGDGSIDTLTSSNPFTYTYNQSGELYVCLIVIDSLGCQIPNYCKKDTIYISPLPVVNFSTVGPAASCDTPFTAQFLNQTNVVGTPYYTWYFGDGQISYDVSPSHTYTNPGVYNVSLVVENASGCKDSLTKISYIQVNNVDGTITLSDDTLCSGVPLLYSVASSGASSLEWTWPCCGITSNATSSIITFPASAQGYQTVQLILNGFGSCKDTIYDSVYVAIVNPSFTPTSFYSCQYPVNIPFVNNSSATGSIASVFWQFSNGDTSSLLNPTITFDTSGFYNVQLTVTSNMGCSNSVFLDSVVEIKPLNPTISVDTSQGCAPITSHFTGGLSGGNPGLIQSWLWNFDDPGSGVNNTSNIQNPSHAFANAGNYQVTLTVTDTLGCVDSKTFLIRAGTRQNAGFSVGVDSACANFPVPFLNLSTDTNLINQYYWQFGDGGVGVYHSPAYQYTDTGYMNVQLVVGYNGCYDTLTIDSAVYIMAPIVEISASIDCANPHEASILMTEKGAHRWYIDLGDGSPIDSVSYNITHTYLNTGDDTIKVIAYNDSTHCFFEASTVVHIRDLTAGFTPVSGLGCINNAVNFDGTSSNDANSWAWHIQGDLNTYSGSTLQYTFDSVGIYQVKLVAGAANDCFDSIVHSIQIFNIQANFSFDTALGCVPLIVHFTDSSIADNGIAMWNWTFGDNTTDSVPNPAHTYVSNGVYTVILTITDSIGCTAQKASPVPIQALNPNIHMAVSDSVICIGDSVRFNNLTTNIGGGSLSYTWHFGDGQTSTLTSPTHVYADSGIFNISLVATDLVYGCSDSVVFYSSIQVQAYPEVHFYANPSFANCLPGIIQFTDSTISDYEVSWQWIYGDGSSTNDTNQNPVKAYYLNGLYDITLIVTTSAGCKDTLTRNNYISIQGPYAHFSISQDTLCKGQSITFSIDTLQNVTQLWWDFGDGQIDTISNSDTVTHTYYQLGTLIPHLFLQPHSPCSVLIDTSVFVHFLSANFSLSDTALCLENANPLFQNLSVGADTWQWLWGDGTSTTGTSPLNHAYANTGNFMVGLAVTDNESGCIDTAFKNLHIKTVEGILPRDTFMCIGDSVQLFAFAQQDGTYQWHHSSGYLSNDSISSPIVSDIKNFLVSVIMKDSSGCIVEDTIHVNVIDSFSVSLVHPASGDTTIIIGETANLEVHATGLATYVYSWSPDVYLSCANCYNPLSKALETTLYTVSVSDSNQCFSKTIQVKVEVLKDYKATVPTAFTPNGDGNNDVIYVRGWGIKELKEYRIYNRWGELVYDNPQDIKQGWDGTYKGKIQDPDTYAVTVLAIGINNEQITYKGYINIIK